MGKHDIIIRPDATLREAMARVNEGAMQFVAVADDENRLIGVVTDGDIRRGILRGLELDSKILDCVNRHPKTMRDSASTKEMLALMKKEHLHQLVILDEDDKIVDVKYLDDLLQVPQKPNEVVLMVGGLGSRLGNLTQSTPKPMLPIGGKPLLETILEDFIEQGFKIFWLAVNYKSDIIESHFGDGSKMGCTIRYLREEKRLGTAGALSLLPHMPDHPLIVSNGDLLLRLDFNTLLDHHAQMEADITMGVREFEYQVPYGVVRTHDEKVTEIEEKPIQQFLIAGGLYVLSPHTLGLVPKSQFWDMPDLIEKTLETDGRVEAFRINGYWLDIGQRADYEQAQREFDRLFKDR